MWTARTIGQLAKSLEQLMTVDLTGGISAAREYALARRPEDPEMRDSVSF